MPKSFFLIKFLSTALILLTAKVAFSQSVSGRTNSSIPPNSDVTTGCYIQRTDSTNLNLDTLCKKVIEPINLTKQTKEDESKDELDDWAEETKYLAQLNELKNRIQIRNRNIRIRINKVCNNKGKCSSIIRNVDLD